MLRPGGRIASERGQILVLFVAIFSVVLALAAFAIDQGFWYGRRTIARTDADAAARAGALGLLNAEYHGAIGDGVSGCGYAASTLRDNGGAFANSDVCGINFIERSDCFGDSRDMPSLTARIEADTRSFFSRRFGIKDINVAAQATACVGSVTTLKVSPSSGASSFTPDKALPFVLRANNGACFSGGTIVLSTECTIYGSFNANANQRVLAGAPANPDECYGSNPGPATILANIASTCTVGACGGANKATQCLGTKQITSKSDHRKVLDNMKTWLSRPSPCQGGNNSYRFQDAFGYGDGYTVPDEVPVPPAIPLLGDTTDYTRSIVYVEKDCISNPRVVVLPISDGSNGADKPVKGFVTVYITGCYRDNAPFLKPNPAAETNKCDIGGGGGGDDECGGDGDGDHKDEKCDEERDTRYEIRGIPIQTFILDGAIGDIDTRTPNAPLTIQTVK